MIVRQTSIGGVFELGLEPVFDVRGFFAALYDRGLFKEFGQLQDVHQVSLSWNERRLTLRGMHYQADPEPEPKLVRCVKGLIYDVVVDLRPASPTYLEWHATQLSATERLAVHVPSGCAHGFLTLTEGAEVLYLIGASYRPNLARGVRWDDPAFGIEWPEEPAVIATRDATYADFRL